MASIIDIPKFNTQRCERLFALNPLFSQLCRFRRHAIGGEPIMAFNGANHKSWPESETFAGAGTWSEATMSKHDVEKLLGKIRNFSRKG